MGDPRSLVLLGMVGALLGCTGHRPEGRAPALEWCAVVFQIDNEGPDAVDVFVYRGGRIRLGTVPAWRSARLTSMAASAPEMRIRLIARPLAGGQPVSTDELLLGAGDLVRWTITQPLEYSSITAVVENGGAGGGGGECARARRHRDEHGA